MNPHGNHKQKSLIATQKIKENRVPLQKKNHKITEKENKRGRKKQLLKRNQKTIK